MGLSRSRVRAVDSLLDLVGQTPLVRLSRLSMLAPHPDVEVYGKLEFVNPGGSVKDRPARQILIDALEAGRFARDQVLIDATSGNMGVSYAMLGAALALPIALVMPSNVSEPRKRAARAFGAKLILSDASAGMEGAIAHLQRLLSAEPGRYYYPDQYSNPSNVRAHYLGTGVELLAELGDRLTHFVAGVGTSGTLMGVAQRLRASGSKASCIVVQPAEVDHGLSGLKHLATSTTPPIFDGKVLDDTLYVSTEDAWQMTELLARQEGLHVGPSSGANVWAAVHLALREKARGRRACVATILCDRGERYFQAPAIGA